MFSWLQCYDVKSLLLLSVDFVLSECWHMVFTAVESVSSELREPRVFYDTLRKYGSIRERATPKAHYSCSLGFGAQVIDSLSSMA